MTITITRERLNALIVAFLSVVLAAVLAACGSGTPTGNQVEAADQNDVTTQLIKNQPIPKPLTSQMRANLIEIEQAQIEGVQTTSFFFNPNVRDPYLICPSVGTPISAAASLSNPTQLTSRYGQNSNYVAGTVDQMDPNGVYTPRDSLGTYALCIQPDGRVIATYSEGYVHVEYAPATWDQAAGRVVITGAPSGKFTKGKK